MGYSCESVLVLTLSHALAITDSGANALAHTLTGAGTTSVPCTGTFRDQLSWRPSHVFQEDLH